MSKYDRFMLHVDLGTEEKLADFTEAERLCHIVGVLAIAAKSPIRGRLIVGEAEAGAAHVAKRADVSKRVAESTLRKLKQVGILVRDEVNGAWAVHNWEAFNPPPKKDRTNAARQARYRARHADSNGVANGAVTASNAREVEGEVEVTPPHPLPGEQPADDKPGKPPRPKHGGKPVDEPTARRLHRALLAFDAQAGTSYAEHAVTATGKWSPNASRILTALKDYPQLADESRCAAVIRLGLSRDPYWLPGAPEPRHVFGQNVIEGLVTSTDPGTASTPPGRDADLRRALLEGR